MIPMITLYSETHFRFGGISPSLLFKREPEVIFDCPARLAPDKSLPVMLLLNDIHRFPADVLSVEFALTASGKNIESQNFTEPESYEVDFPFSFRTRLYHFNIAAEKLVAGWNTLHAVVKISVRGKEKTILNDNYRTASQRPFSVFVADEAFPGSDSAHFGDLHCHSIHSNSHVEFGAPLKTVKLMGEATGLSFTAVTDHSYDLECDPSDYLNRDPHLSNWKIQQEGCCESDQFTLITGEEISGRRERGGVVHLGAFGHHSFIRGSGDGARKNYKRSDEPSLQKAASQVIKEGGITFAAHPGEYSSLLQRLLLRRGNWVQTELTDSVTAIQGINGMFNHFWYVTRKLWIQSLLMGKRIPLVAGNDAHGDFNRYRAIGSPFIRVKEDFLRYFGLARTGIYSDSFSQSDILSAVREGRTFITDGPFASIVSNGKIVVGEEISLENEIAVIAESSNEFGSIRNVKLFCGCFSENDEQVWIIPVEDNCYLLDFKVEAVNLASVDYLRVEVETEPGRRHFPAKAVTSAVYIKS